jgi:hypothetical protein
MNTYLRNLDKFKIKRDASLDHAVI